MRSSIRSFDGSDPGDISEFLDDYTTVCDQNEILEGTAAMLMPDYLKGTARQVLQNYLAKHDDPVTKFSRCPFYFEVVNHMLQTYATEPTLRAADTKISNLTQQSSQTAVDFHGVIVKVARRYGGAYPFDDIVDVFLRGVDERIVSVHSEWLKLSREASNKASSESGRLIRRREAFNELLAYADGHRPWEVSAPKSKAYKTDRRRERKSDTQAAYGTTVSAVAPTNPPASTAPRSVEVRVDPFPAPASQPASNASGLYDPKYPHCPPPPPLDTPPGSRPLTDDEIRRVNGGDKCFFCMTPKTPPAANAPPVASEDADVPMVGPHFTTGCHLLLGNPVRYGLVRLRLKTLRQLYGNRAGATTKSTKPTQAAGQSGHYVHPTCQQAVNNISSVASSESTNPTDSTQEN